jgi:hypothetical protein
MAARIEKSEIINRNNCLNDLFQKDSFDGISADNNTHRNIDFLNFLTDYLIQATDVHDQDIVLNITKKLIFHPRPDVVASSRGKLYFIIKDEKIQKFIIDKLKELRINADYVGRKYIDESMESIAAEENNIGLFKVECNVFNNLVDKFGLYLHSAWNRVPHYMDDKYRLKLQNSRLPSSFDDMFFSFFQFKTVMDDMELENSNEKMETNELNIFPYVEIMDFEKNKETNFNNLIDVYALTFREKGHINHIMSILNEDDPEIRHKGIDGLIYVLKVLNNYEEQIPFEPMISEVLNTVCVSISEDN